MRSARVVPTLSVVLLFAMACGNPAASNEVDGQYRLARINGSPIPSPNDGCGIPVLSGSLHIEQGIAARSVSYQINGTPQTTTGTGPVTFTGPTVHFAFTQTGGWIWEVTGTWSPGRITISYPAPCDGTITEEFDRE